MQSGAITGYMDVAQVVLYAFFIFFAGLVLYLRREDKREGYPLESDSLARGALEGFPRTPTPKTFVLQGGGTYSAPPGNPDTRPLRAEPIGDWPGAPLEPTGNPMLDGVGPAAYADRSEKPDLTFEGELKIVPLRVAEDHGIVALDADPCGMTVIGADRAVAGTVKDAWIDRSEPQIRYLEVELAPAIGVGCVLLPIGFTKIDGRRREIKVTAILAHQFADVPALQNPDQVSLREEDRISAYYAGGTLYAEPSRLGPLL